MATVKYKKEFEVGRGTYGVVYKSFHHDKRIAGAVTVWLWSSRLPLCDASLTPSSPVFHR